MIKVHYFVLVVVFFLLKDQVHGLSSSKDAESIAARSNQNNRQTVVRTTVSSALTFDNMKFSRMDSIQPKHYYNTYNLTVSNSGVYNIFTESNIDTVGYLYNGSFSEYMLNDKLMEFNDNGGINAQFNIEAYLEQHETYVVVVSTFDQWVTGSYTLVVSGLEGVNLTQTSTDFSTPAPVYTTEQTPVGNLVETVYDGILDQRSPVYSRPWGGRSMYYYHYFSLVAPTAGYYTIFSDSQMDLYGFFYEYSFTPYFPLQNLLASNDDHGGYGQFNLKFYLEQNKDYSLIVTAYNRWDTGSYTVIVSGPASVTLTKLDDDTTMPLPSSEDYTHTEEPPIGYTFNTTIISEWTTLHPQFVHPGNPNAPSYYDTYVIRGQVSGQYVISSQSDYNLDPMGYLYNGPFQPDQLFQNLIYQDDDRGGGRQFRIVTNLDAQHTYTLVATHFGSVNGGRYSVTIEGMAPVSFYRTTIMETGHQTHSTPDFAVTTETTSLSSVNTTISSAWTNSNPTYTPWLAANGTYFYDSFEISVPVDGSYTIASDSNIDTYGFLYNGYFWKDHPEWNLITADNDNGGNRQFRLDVHLASNKKYILVATSVHKWTTGFYDIIVTGPAHVNLIRTTFMQTSTNSYVTTDSSSVSKINTTLSSALTNQSPTFARPGSGNAAFYYDVFDIRTELSGLYAFGSSGTIDTYGFFYADAFVVENPYQSLISRDDDSGTNANFHFEFSLEANRWYSLVVTTKLESVTGPYTVIVSGDSRVILYQRNIASSTEVPDTTEGSGEPATAGTHVPLISTLISAEWTANHPTFMRPNAQNGTFYYDTFDIIAYRRGAYTIRSQSNIDTYGCLYRRIFIPERPEIYQVLCNDDDGGSSQFQIRTTLESNEPYILVATAFGERTTGQYTIQVTGEMAVTLRRTTDIGITVPTTVESHYTTESSTPYPFSNTISSSWGYQNPMFSRPDRPNSSFYYDTFDIRVTTPGMYSIFSSSNIDTIGYLYLQYFAPEDPYWNLALSDDDNGTDRNFRINIYLETNQLYQLVATTYVGETTGVYSVTVSGNAWPRIHRTTTYVTGVTSYTTRNPEVTSDTGHLSYVNSTYFSEITRRNPTYNRGNTSNSIYYYDTIEIRALVSGVYGIGSDSSFDTYGCLYRHRFIPANPDWYLVVCDDNSNVQRQFRFDAYLDWRENHILVVTSFDGQTTGRYSIIASGPANVSFSRTTFLETTTRSHETTEPSHFFPINTTVSSSLSGRNPTFVRPFESTGPFAYDTFQIIATTPGWYRIGTGDSYVDTYGCLYNESFTPEYPQANLMRYDDNSGTDENFRFDVYLQHNTLYTLVVTTGGALYGGPYTLVVSGPDRVVMYRTTIIQPTDVTPTNGNIETTMHSNDSHLISVQLSSAWTRAHPTFNRPNASVGAYYYDTFIVRVPTSGDYAISSRSSIDTYGLLYKGYFLPNDPTLNLITENDDSGSNNQFRLDVHLEANHEYTLVATTFSQSNIGSYTVVVTGAAPAWLVRTTVIESTSTPEDVHETTEPSIEYLTNTSYVGHLTSGESVFVRPGGSSASFFYDRLLLSVNVDGWYYIGSRSSVDTFVCLYEGTFYADHPSTNLVQCKHNNDGNSQFQFAAFLQTTRTYYLVVTTNSEWATGLYQIIVSGRASVYLQEIDPTEITSTSIPAFLVNTTTTSTLTANNPLYQRVNFNRSTYYDTYDLTILKAGSYWITSNSSMDMYGFLYNGTFYPDFPFINLIASDDDGNGNNQFRILAYLKPGTRYILVVTTFQERATGFYELTVSGPHSVGLFLTTSGPSNNGSSETDVVATYSNALTTSSPRFVRPRSSYQCYFQAIQVSVPVSGNYTLKSSSFVDAYGYLYLNVFNPYAPDSNILTSDDDSGGNQQFLIQTQMYPGIKYILIYTTHSSDVTTSFQITASGPGKANLIYQHIDPIRTTTVSSATTNFKITSLKIINLCVFILLFAPFHYYN